MKQVLLFVCFVSFFAFTSAQVTVNCATLSGSCAKCMLAGCNYVWTAPGFYNSSANATCLNTAEYVKRQFNNQYTKTIWAYALPESGPLAVNSTRGQYLLSKTNSSLNYFAQPVPCYDRQLCYCKPMPPPPPSRLIIIVRNIVTLEVIPGASLNTTVENGTSSSTDLTGKVVFDPVAPSNGYFANACAVGYTCNSTTTPAIGTNMTVTVTIYLQPLPCILTVKTVFDIDGSIAAGARLVTAGFADQVTPASGLATYTLTNFPAAGSVNGFLAGYTSLGAQPYACGLGGSVTIVIRFIPIPNIVIVTVLDARTFELITTAFVTLTVTQYTEQSVDSTATTTFSSVAGGNYVANGRASGYTSNSTIVPTITTNTTVHVYVYLTQLPCRLRVIVLTSQNHSLPIAAAAVNINGGSGFTRTSNGVGVVDYVLPYNNATTASASKVGYGPGSETFTCGKGDNVTVIIYLPEVLQIVFSAADAKTIIGEGDQHPLLSNFTLRFDGVDVPADKTDTRYHYLLVNSLPITGEVIATSQGFNDQTDTGVKFTLTSRNYTILLAPQEFTVFFTPIEEVSEGGLTGVRRQDTYPANGVVQNNYWTLGERNTSYVAYVPKDVITVGGSVFRDSVPVSSATYVLAQTFEYDNGTRLSIMTGKFDNISPSTFLVRADDATQMNANWPSQSVVGATKRVTLKVPEFTETTNRKLLFFFPYSINSGYVVVRVSTRDSAGAKSVFGQNDFILVTVSTSGNSPFNNYNSKNVQMQDAPLAIFEFPFAFQTKINGIAYSASSVFNLTLSNYINPDTGALLTSKAGNPIYDSLNSFTFDLTSSIFNFDTATGQKIRDVTKHNYLTRDYVLVQKPPQKKREESD